MARRFAGSRGVSLGLLAALLVGGVSCSSGPSREEVDGRALAFMEKRAQQIDANREQMSILSEKVDMILSRMNGLETSFSSSNKVLDSSREEIKKQLAEMVRLKNDLESSRSRLSSMADAVKELHAWTAGILKNRSDLESMQDVAGKNDERLDALAQAVEGLRETGARIVEAQDAIETLSQMVQSNADTVGSLQGVTEDLAERSETLTVHSKALQSLTATQTGTNKEVEELRTEIEKLEVATASAMDEMAKGDQERAELRKELTTATEAQAESVAEGGKGTPAPAGEPAPNLNAQGISQALARLQAISESATRASEEVQSMRGLLKVLDKRLKTLESDPAAR